MRRLRLTLRLVVMVLALLVALVLHGLWRLVRAPSPWPRLLLGSVARIAGARVRIVGTPLRRDAFFVANHQSWLDILLLAGATGTAFVAKGELARVPLIGWLCRLNHTLFIDRADRMGVTRQVAAVRAALDAGWSLAIFPEGTTDGGGTTLLPFKPALFAVVEPPPPRLRVQPVWLDYGAATPDIAWIGEEPGATNARRVVERPGNFLVTLHFLAPFDPAEVGDRKAVAAESRRRIAAAMAGERASSPL